RTAVPALLFRSFMDSSPSCLPSRFGDSTRFATAALVPDRVKLFARSRPAHNRAMPWATPLLGRSAELVELEHERRQAAAGEFRCPLVSADPGVGKPRLASEFLGRQDGRATVLSARAYPLGETTSFGVWSEALEGHLRLLSAAEISELCGGFLDDLAGLIRSVGAVRGAVPEREPPRLRVLEGLALLLGNLASRG